MGPEAQCLTRALKAPTPHEPVTRLAEQARRSASRSRRPGGSGGCWRGSAGPRGAGAGRAGTGVGTGLSPRRGSADPTLAGAWLVRTVHFAAMNMLSNSGNELLVFGCEYSVNDTHRNSA